MITVCPVGPCFGMKQPFFDQKSMNVQMNLGRKKKHPESQTSVHAFC